MKVSLDTIILKGAPLGKENPMPVLRDVDIHLKVEKDASLDEQLSETIGHYCGKRVLPYKMQDGYTRENTQVEIKTVVLENDILKATFLPEYGGRLYSLYNKVLKRELLSVNPVFQPANLGLRNAWFSGGIEWNMAQFGHTYLSCDHVYFGLVKSEEGDFIRLYEYERVKQLYYQIDFHLPKGSDQLLTYTKIWNDKEEETPLYYWSNTAVSELGKARVFSATDDVMYMKPLLKNGEMTNAFASGQMPYLEGIEGDVSYPRNFVRSNEYFYQTNAATDYPWEAVGYEDGFLFYECSSKPLKHRKMFCWGTHRGGTKWQDYLSRGAKDKYVEIQAGLFPSQLHQGLMSPESSIEFFQLFGGKYTKVDYYQDLESSTKAVESTILDDQPFMALEDKLKEASFKSIDNVLHHGRAYGYLEELKTKVSKASMTFTDERIDEVLPLVALLEKEKIDIDLDYDEFPYITDIKWLDTIDENDSEYALFLKALIYWENRAFDKALFTLEHPSESLLVNYTLAQMKTKLELNPITSYEKAYAISKSMPVDVRVFVLTRDYVNYLNQAGAYKKAYEIGIDYMEVYEEIRYELATTLLELEKYEELDKLLSKPLERIREGNNALVDVWFKLQMVRQSLTEDEARALTPPEHLDFRMM